LNCLPINDAFSDGAVIFSSDGIELGRGHTDNEGVHAIELAINSCEDDITGSILYVTTEPCIKRFKENKLSCVRLIKNAGFHMVVFGAAMIQMPFEGAIQLEEFGITVHIVSDMKEACLQATRRYVNI
jgi:pyrimidine deaminase RibD-like protein